MLTWLDDTLEAVLEPILTQPHQLILFLIYLTLGLLAAILSWRCYPDDDESPPLVKLLYASAAFWSNPVYLVGYFFNYVLMAKSCDW